MSTRIAIRREDKSVWERRVPLTPRTVRRLVHEHGLEVVVQSSPRRVFTDKDFTRAGATVSASTEDAPVVLGVKEVPGHLLEPGRTYMCFAHVIKGQPQNMPTLRRLMELGCTLVDYERVVDDFGRRVIFFGRYAGLAGAIDSLWALGRRLQWERIPNPFSELSPAHTYNSLEGAKEAVRAVGERIRSQGLPPEVVPLIIGVTGYGNVASGVQEILAELPTIHIGPPELPDLAGRTDLAGNAIYRVTFREEDLVVPRSAADAFDLTEYYDHPELYRSRFEHYLPHLTLLANCIFWAEEYPRLVTIEQVQRLWGGEEAPRLRVIGDISCDIEGSIECTVKATDPDDPVYVYDAGSGVCQPGVAGNGPVIMAVDILPSELPRESSEAFSRALHPLVPALARCDWSRPFAELDLPAELRRAVIVHRGALTPDYRYLEEYVTSAAAD